MAVEEERKQNQQAFRRLKKKIAQSYPMGHYVGIVRGKIVADDASFRGLISKLDAIERDPDRRFVIQAGVEYPERVEILLDRTQQQSHSDALKLKEEQ
jgi:hypothetical protein